MMFLTRISSIVTGHSAREAISKYAPDGTLLAEFTLAVGDGSVKYPTMWVVITVWEKLAEQALDVINRKGVKVEASGMLAVRLYEGIRGKDVEIALKNVRELKIYDRNGDFVKVLAGDGELK
jgi:single-stranded DNA-binding protein